MIETDLEGWSKLVAHQGKLLGTLLPSEQAAAWYQELRPFNFLIVSMAVEEVVKHNKMRGWPAFGAVLEKCEILAAEERRAEEEARKVADLRAAAQPYEFVDTGAEAGEFTEEETRRFAKAIYLAGQTQEGRDWLAKQICVRADGFLEGADLRKPLTPWKEPRPMELCTILAKCLRNSINTPRQGENPQGQVPPEKWPEVRAAERVEMRAYVSRIEAYAREQYKTQRDGKAAAGGE
jgi:hypothetical protein